MAQAVHHRQRGRASTRRTLYCLARSHYACYSLNLPRRAAMKIGISGVVFGVLVFGFGLKYVEAQSTRPFSLTCPGRGCPDPMVVPSPSNQDSRSSVSEEAKGHYLSPLERDRDERSYKATPKSGGWSGTPRSDRGTSSPGSYK